MVKTLFAIFLASSLFSFEKLDPKYQVRYGDSGVEVVEYFSLSCKKCLEWFEKDFGGIRADYVDCGKASFVFHPNPADLTTLQMMVCLERLSPEQKPVFLEALLECLAESKGKYGCAAMQAGMQALGEALPELDQIEFLEKTCAFQDALKYLKQENVIALVPTLEIDGVMYDKLPTRKFLDEQINQVRTP